MEWSDRPMVRRCGPKWTRGTTKEVHDPTIGCGSGGWTCGLMKLVVRSSKLACDFVNERAIQ